MAAKAQATFSPWRLARGAFMCLAAFPCLADQTTEQPRLFWLSIPAAAKEPIRADAEVKFVSNGYFLREDNCTVIRSSGNLVADQHACKTVIFKKAEKPVTATAPVWIAETTPAGYQLPTKTKKGPPISHEDYPSASLNKGEQGTVVLRILVQSDGKVGSCDVAATSGYERLDNAAKRSLCKRLKMNPATLDGNPIASINFTQVAFYAGK